MNMGEPFHNLMMVRHWHPQMLSATSADFSKDPRISGMVDRIFAWCYANCRDRWTWTRSNNDFQFYFRSDGDRTAFALTWGQL